MKRRSLLPCGLVALALFGGASAPTPAPAGAPFETWRFNARERTARGLAQLATDPRAAAENLATAGRLEPDDPRAQLNAGAGWMVAGETPRALEALEQAARLAAETSENGQQPGLAAEAQYQLGTAKLEAGDLEGSIEALRESLRRDPSAEDAKHNLELALRRKQKQDEEKRQQEKQDQDKNQKPQPDNPPKPQDQQQQEEGEDSEPTPPTPPTPQPKPGEAPNELKNWQPQPDMTQAQAEALLEAVENRERQQRRDEAKKRAIKRSREEKDW